MAAPSRVKVELSTVTSAIAADYRYAADHLADFAQILCYCGCDRSLSHQNLADCYVTPTGAWDAHASGCAVCGNETATAREQLAADAPIADVRDSIIAQYGPPPSLFNLSIVMTNTTTRQPNASAHLHHWILGMRAYRCRTPHPVRSRQRRSSPRSTAARTGEINSMGMPIIATPGEATGVAEGDGVTATPSRWALGTVPLDVAVLPNWRLQNIGTELVTLGQPHVQINEGCCPGALTYTGPTTLEPDEATELTFEPDAPPAWTESRHDHPRPRSTR